MDAPRPDCNPCRPVINTSAARPWSAACSPALVAVLALPASRLLRRLPADGRRSPPLTRRSRRSSGSEVEPPASASAATDRSTTTGCTGATPTAGRLLPRGRRRLLQRETCTGSGGARARPGRRPADGPAGDGVAGSRGLLDLTTRTTRSPASRRLRALLHRRPAPGGRTQDYGGGVVSSTRAGINATTALEELARGVPRRRGGRRPRRRAGRPMRPCSAAWSTPAARATSTWSPTPPGASRRRGHHHGRRRPVGHHDGLPRVAGERGRPADGVVAARPVRPDRPSTTGIGSRRSTPPRTRCSAASPGSSGSAAPRWSTSSTPTRRSSRPPASSVSAWVGPGTQHVSLRRGRRPLRQRGRRHGPRRLDRRLPRREDVPDVHCVDCG